MIDIDNILFRASGIWQIMGASKNVITEKQLSTIDELMNKRTPLTNKQQEELNRLIDKRDNPDVLSETCKTYLRKLYRSVKHSREDIVTSKYIEKGVRHEQNAITLLSLYKNKYLKKNDERLNNRFVTGEPDVFVGPEIRKSTEGYDTKVSWSLFTLPYKDDEVDTPYYWQDMTYIALTGADKWTTAHCLINSDATSIMREKERVNYALADEDGRTPDGYPEHPFYDLWIKRQMEIEKNMIFDMEMFKERNPIFYQDNILLKGEEWKFDIPIEERVVEFVVHRDNEVIESMYERVKECRSWMKTNLQ
jgi:hypothetical protein